MAYVVGIVSKDERAELERRGWEIEKAPNELVPPKMEDDEDFIMVWVDSSLFGIMDGPDWENG